MYAQLKLAGITGIAYIEIVGGRPDAKVLKPHKGHIPVIPSKPSALSKLSDTLPEATMNMSETFHRINETLNPETIARIHDFVKNLDESVRRLNHVLSDENTRNLSRLIANLADASGHLDELYRAADAVAAVSDTWRTEGNRTLVEIRKSAESIRRLGEKLELRSDQGDYDVRAMVEGTLGKTNALLRETQTLIYDLQEDARMLKESPRDLLFKEQTPLPGPGERP
jgi:phospholipid/cholesterol/gamma-HCH transport system substrate-binding protein